MVYLFGPDKLQSPPGKLPCHWLGCHCVPFKASCASQLLSSWEGCVYHFQMQEGSRLGSFSVPQRDAANLSRELRLVTDFVFSVQLLLCIQYVCLAQLRCSAVTEWDDAQRAHERMPGWSSPCEKDLQRLSRAFHMAEEE